MFNILIPNTLRNRLADGTGVSAPGRSASIIC